MTKTKIVEMTCKLMDCADQKRQLPAGYMTRSLAEFHEDDLYSCYLAAFRTGDSLLFSKQNPAEQREFYESLAFEQARETAGSSLLLSGNAIVGFTFLLPYGEGNRRISCMCVHPEHQRQGLGAFMLQLAQQEALRQGTQTITLWTEVEMGAFALYRKYGFDVTEEREL